MSRNEQYNLTGPLSVHGDQFNKVMTTGPQGGWESLATQRLKEPFAYRDETYEWLTMGRFLTDHSEGEPITHGLVEFHPSLGIKLQAEREQTFGLVTDITFAPFSLSAPFFEGDTKPPISHLLRPTSFDVYIGEGDIDDAVTELIRDGKLGTKDEYGDVARAAGHSLMAAAEVLQDLTFEQVEGWYRP